jgi:hypothetical protein
MIPQKLSPCLKCLELSSKFGDADHTRDEFYILRLEQVFILSLRVFRDKANRMSAWIEQGVR